MPGEGPSMFLRPYQRFKDGKEHTYYALVESVRTANGPRQNIVAYLGELNHDQERRWQRTVVFYNRQGDAQQLRLFPEAEDVPLPDDPDIVQVRLGQVGWTNPRRFGDVWLAWQLWQRLHLDVIVDRHCRWANRPVARRISSPSKSSTACAHRAASSRWRSTGTPPRPWRNCWVSPTPRSRKIACIALWTACVLSSKPSKTT